MRINEPVLAAVLAALKNLSGRVDAERPRLDGVLGLKGVVDVIDEEESEDLRRAAEAAIIADFGQALAGLSDMRRHEGDAIGTILSARLDEIAQLSVRAEKVPGRQPDAIKKKIAEQVAVLLDHPAGLIPTGCIRKRS